MDWGSDYQQPTHGGQFGGANGGGFMAGDNQSSQNADRGDREESSLRPITVKQLNEATASPDGKNFTLDNHKLTGLVLIGQIRSSSGQTLKQTYRIDDGTGMCEVTIWLSNDQKTKYEEGTFTTLANDIYVRVHGRIKEFNNKRYVVANFIRPIEDHNEIACHYLDATVAHLQFTRGAAKAGGARGDGLDEDKMDIETAGAGNSEKLKRVNPTARKVWQYLTKAEEGSDGVNIYTIGQALGLDVNTVQGATEQLLDQHLIYSTADDETFAPLDDSG